MAEREHFCDICCKSAKSLNALEKHHGTVPSEELLPGSNGSKILNATTSDAQSPFSACKNCEETIVKALDLQCKIATLQNEIDRLGKVLVNQLHQSRQREYTERSPIGIKLRELLHPGHSDFHAFTNVKQEVNVDDFPFDEDDGDFDESLDFEDSVIKEELSEIRKSQSSNQPKNQLNDDDSDFEETLLEHVGKAGIEGGKNIYKYNTYDTNQDGHFICKLCESVYTSYPGIKKHYRMHRESRLLGKIYDCEICRHPNISDSNLRRHMTKIHSIQKLKEPGKRLSKILISKKDVKNTTDDTIAQTGLENDTKVLTSVDVCANDGSDSDADYIPIPSRRHKPNRKFRIKSRLLKIAKRRIAKASMILPGNDNGTCEKPVPAPTGAYPCKLCDSVYTTIPGYRKHMRAHQQSKLLEHKYDCPICKHPTLSESNLRRHFTAIHHQQPKRSLEEETTPSTTKINAGPSTTTNENLSFIQPVVGNFPCNRCSTVYTSFPGIRKHEGIHAESDKLNNAYDCPICRHPTISERNLRIHISVTHQNKVSSEQHEELSKRFPNMDIERLQILSSDNLEISRSGSLGTENASSDTSQTCQQSSSVGFSCDRCASVYISVTGIRKHEQTHEESDILGNKFDCPICRHPTISEKNLRIHMTSTHQMKMFCQNQGKVPSTKLVNPRTVSEVGDEITGTKSISVENKSFMQSSDGKYYCKFCESVYTTHPGIRKHERMHKGSNMLGNKYDCSVCRHPNLSESRMLRHMKKFHNIILQKQERNDVDKVLNCVSQETKEKPIEKTPTENYTLNRTRRAKTKSNDESYNDGISEDDDVDDTKSDRNDEDWTPLKDESVKDTDPNQCDESDIDSDVEQSAKRSSKSETEMKALPYQCQKCNVGYKSSRGYERHQREHLTSISLGHKYDCHCGFPASSERRLRYHKRRAHLDAFTCSVCNYRVAKPEQLIGHMRRHYKSGQAANLKTNGKDRRVRIRCERASRRMECEKCKAKYWYLRSYKKHLEDHDKSKLIGNIWDCSVCNFPCLSEKQRERHATTHGQRNVTCHFCQKTCANPAMLKAHVRLHVEYDKAKDPETGLFSCKLCPYIGISRRALLNHKTALHRDVVLDSSVQYLLCGQCGKNFYTEGTLRKHVKNIHENTYTYTCEKCGKGFDSKSAFSSHKMTHEKIRIKQHICDICGVAYSHKYNLQSHISKFHNVGLHKVLDSVRDGRRFPKEKSYKCKWCQTLFPFKYMLVNHMPTAHSDMYDKCCDQCDKKYMTASSLKLHKEIVHSNGSQKYSCKYCHKEFVHKHYVICHYRFCETKKSMDRTRAAAASQVASTSAPKNE